MKAYKVTVNFSSFFAQPLSVGYRIGHKTLPKTGKIFVFKNPIDAISFIRSYKCLLNDFDRNHIIILYGEAENATHVKKVCVKESCFARFWELKKQHKTPSKEVETYHSPTGTFVCTTFTPEKIAPFSWEKKD